MASLRPFKFDPEKALQVILYVANKAAIPDIIHVCKCLYYADKKQLERSGSFICGDSYIAMANGPVPSGTYDLIRDVQDTDRQISLWADAARNTFRLKGFRIISLKPLDISVFSKSELESLDWAIENYGGLTIRQLIAETQKEKPYKEADFNGQITIESIAKSLPDADLLLQYLREPDPEFEPA
jgi:hypothetical protein